LLSFRQQYPKAIPSAFISTPDEILEKLLQKDCEFTLSFAKVVAPQVEFEALREEPMALVVRSDIWTASSGSVTSRLNKILDQHGYISSVGAHLQTRPTRVLKELFGRMPKIGLEVNGQESQKRICMAGGGVAYLSRFMVAREIEAGLLQEINVGQGHVFKLWLATRRGQELTTGSRVFIERLRGL
jgi:DNA-binding transcriptional LysR family regulator